MLYSVKSRKSFKILILDGNDKLCNLTENTEFQEMFKNL